MNARSQLLVIVFSAVALLGGVLVAAEPAERTYWVQLVRGTTEKEPPSSDCKPIGPKISKTFLPVFKWSHYWEMNRQEVKVAVGGKKTVRLNQQRSVEIDLTDKTKRKVTAFEGDKPVFKTVDPIGNSMSIIGGDRDTNSSWFIVVRGDKPVGAP